MSVRDDNTLVTLTLRRGSIKNCISGLGWEMSECDCGRPEDEVWVKEYQDLIKLLEKILRG